MGSGTSTLFQVATFGLTILIEYGFVWAVLHLLNLQSRIYQTFFALVGVSAVFQTLILLVSLLGQVMTDPNQSGSAVSVPFIATLFVVSIWFLIAGGHVFRSALESSLLRGVLLILALGVLQLIAVFLSYFLAGVELNLVER